METQTLPEMGKEIKDNIENFFIQIDKSKLLDYISKGLICPDKFLGEEIEKDIQSYNDNFLIISNGFFNKLDDKQLLLEIILTDKEKQNLQKINSIFYLDKSLPITRIKTIYCHSQKDSKEIINFLLSYQSGYISEKLFKTFPKGKNKLKQYSLSKIENIKNIEYKEYTEKLLKYDKVMGMFSFIKNTNLYYVNNTGLYSNYSDKYFEFYNTETNLINIKKWIKENFYTTEIGKKFINKLQSEEYIDGNFIKEIIEIINDSTLKHIFTELLSDPVSKKRILKLLEKENEDIYYFICLLYIYSKKGSNAKDILKDNITKEIPFEKAEKALALFGLYYGYSSLRAYEEIKIEDKFYKKIQKDNMFNIKFKFDSYFDYNLVEAIYQYSFNNQDKKIINSYTYLDEINIKHKIIQLPTNNEFKRWYKVKKNKIKDILDIHITREKFSEIAIERIIKYPIQVEAKYKIFSFVYERYNDLIEYQIDSTKKSIKLCFERDKFIKKIQDEIDEKIQNKLLENIELDKK